jgi:hypothetical protein
MKLLDAAGSGNGNWKAVPAGLWSIGVHIPSAGTITFEVSYDGGTTNLGQIVDSSGSAVSLTATSAKYVVELPDCHVRAVASGVSGGNVTAFLQPTQLYDETVLKQQYI